VLLSSAIQCKYWDSLQLPHALNSLFWGSRLQVGKVLAQDLIKFVGSNGHAVDRGLLWVWYLLLSPIQASYIKLV